MSKELEEARSKVDSTIGYLLGCRHFLRFNGNHREADFFTARIQDLSRAADILSASERQEDAARVQAREGSKAGTPQRDSARSTAVEPDPEGGTPK